MIALENQIAVSQASPVKLLSPNAKIALCFSNATLSSMLSLVYGVRRYEGSGECEEDILKAVKPCRTAGYGGSVLFASSGLVSPCGPRE